MIFSIDLWHGKSGFGFTIVMWERLDGKLTKIDAYGQLKLFGRTWGGNNG